jgi:hypothetical protein
MCQGRRRCAVLSSCTCCHYMRRAKCYWSAVTFFECFFCAGPCNFQEDTSKVDPAKLEELRKAIKLREDVRYLQSFFGCVQYLRPTIFLAGGGRAKAACKDSSSFCASNYVHFLVFFMFHDVCVFRPTNSNKPNERRFRRRRN